MAGSKQKNSSGNTTSQENSKPSLTKKLDTLRDSLRLTDSEIESLRQHKRQILTQLRGRNKDLFEEK